MDFIPLCSPFLCYILSIDTLSKSWPVPESLGFFEMNLICKLHEDDNGNKK